MCVSSEATAGGGVVKQTAASEEAPPQVTMTGASGTSEPWSGSWGLSQSSQLLLLSLFRHVTGVRDHPHNPPAAAHPGGFWDMLFSDAQWKVSCRRLEPRLAVLAVCVAASTSQTQQIYNHKGTEVNIFKTKLIKRTTKNNTG